jgi:magnesium transporter
LSCVHARRHHPSLQLQPYRAYDGELLAGLQERGEFFWLALHDPGEATLRDIGERFGLHELAVEDSERFGQLPKLDQYAGHALLVVYGAAEPGARTERREVHVHVHGDFVITITRRDARFGTWLVSKAAADPVDSEHGLVHRIVDVLIDSLFPAITSLADRIDVIEDAVVTGLGVPWGPRLLQLREDIRNLERVARPQRDVLAVALERLREIPGLDGSGRHRFRDTFDHAQRVVDETGALRGELDAVLELQFGLAAQQQGEAARRLTVLATVFLPLTFVTGFFGQNFGWLVRSVDTRDDFLVWGIGLLLASLLLLLAWFRRRHLI